MHPHLRERDFVHPRQDGRPDLCLSVSGSAAGGPTGGVDQGAAGREGGVTGGGGGDDGCVRAQVGPHLGVAAQVGVAEERVEGITLGRQNGLNDSFLFL